MTNKKLGLILLGVSFLIIGGYSIWKLTDNNSNSTTTQNITHTQTQGEQNNTTISSDEVKKHNSEDDCWTIVQGNVYDITSYIPNHPGGKEILRACGEDGTQLFTTRTDENGEAVGSGTPHSPSAQSQLESMLVGQLE